jgi:hypothetical protein
MITRISVAMGPSQVLDLVTALRYKRASTPPHAYRELLLIGGTCGAIRQSFSMTAACRKLAPLWPFDEIYDIHYLEWLFHARLLSFSAAVASLRKRLRTHSVGEVVVCRNGQFVNELVLSAFAGSENACYGDCGGVDIGWTDRNNNPQGLIPVPDAYVTFPRILRNQVFDNVRVHVMPPEFFLRVLDDAGRLPCSRELFRKPVANDREPVVLILTANLVEAGVAATVTKEIDFYHANVMPYMERDDRIIIKGHPREFHEQSKRLLNILRQQGFKRCHRLPKSRIPIDVLTTTLRTKRVIALGSMGALPFALSQQAEVVVGVDTDLERQFLLSQETNGIDGRHARIVTLIIQQAHAQKAAILSYEDVAQMPWPHPPFPLLVTPSGVSAVR